MSGNGLWDKVKKHAKWAVPTALALGSIAAGHHYITKKKGNEEALGNLLSGYKSPNVANPLARPGLQLPSTWAKTFDVEKLHRLQNPYSHNALS